jgi:hypothetical protein
MGITGNSAPPRNRDQARSHRQACGQGLHRPEISGSLPGYLSPPVYLKFSDVPNGLATFSKCRPRNGIESLPT